MGKNNHNAYDVIIIGAGISGLVCGCYLAKAGLKVLIAEQHYKPGGYCTSFKRKGFTFDAAAHSFGSYRVGGSMHKVINDLELSKRIAITRHNPSDIIVSPEHNVTFWSELQRTTQELQDSFPDEAFAIVKFMTFLTQHKPLEYAALRGKTFKMLLDMHFNDRKLKAILSFPVLGNSNLPSSLVSAFTGIKIYSEFLLDGGYYPSGGMQVLPDILASRFKEYGGEILFSSCVNKIATTGSTVQGVFLEKQGLIASNYVVSSCDARQTFLSLLPPEVLSPEFRVKLESMTPSLSAFILYLGIDNQAKNPIKPGTNLWFLPHYDVEELYLSARKMRTDKLAPYYMVRASPDGNTILAYVNAPFTDPQYWKARKETIMDSLISHIQKNTLPELSKHILFKEAATPMTCYRYTLNQQGAAYGWSPTIKQFADRDFKKPSFIGNLYLTGHWTTYAQGIPGVAFLGYDTAHTIIKHDSKRR